MEKFTAPFPLTLSFLYKFFIFSETGIDMFLISSYT